MRFKFNFLVSILLVIICSSCSKDSDSNLEDNLIYGQWFEIGKCQDQNYLILNEDDTYIWRQSANNNCEINEYPTLEEAGTFSLANDGIFFTIITSEIIENPSGNPLETTLPLPLISSEIISLEESYFEFELTYESEGPGTYQTMNYRFEK